MAIFAESNTSCAANARGFCKLQYHAGILSDMAPDWHWLHGSHEITFHSEPLYCPWLLYEVQAQRDACQQLLYLPWKDSRAAGSSR
jgi:hypothetical protein